jgi:hypothetical protein
MPSELLIALTVPEAALHVVTDPESPEQIVVGDQDGASVLMAYTSAERVPEAVSTRAVPTSALREPLRESSVRLNPASPPSVTLQGSQIVAALDRQQGST